MVAHLFNPENDLALAADVVAYTPPPGAAALRDAGRLLPAWWAADGDCVVVAERYADRAAKLRDMYGLRFTTPGCADVATACSCEPWGWSRAVVAEFCRAGVGRDVMPDDVSIERMRWLSHRRTALKVLGAIGIHDATEAFDIDSVSAYIRRFDGHVYMKSPWSCSGRGVVDVSSMPVSTFMSVASGVIRRQGSVILEPALDRRADFAALFRSGNDGVRFAGWSMFGTSGAGRYAGNIVVSPDALRERIAKIADMAALESCVSRLETILTDLIGTDYRGPLGVDMIATPDGFHPCVEVNLRRTMGFVAADIYRHTGISGTLFYNQARNCFTLREDAAKEREFDVS